MILNKNVFTCRGSRVLGIDVLRNDLSTVEPLKTHTYLASSSRGTIVRLLRVMDGLILHANFSPSGPRFLFSGREFVWENYMYTDSRS